MMDINLRQLEALIYVTETKSFSEAAGRLYLSQSSVSSHIARLEETLGIKLFDRRVKKSIALTEDGRRAYAFAKEIVGLCTDMQESFGTRPPGKDFLTIAASTVPSRYLVPQIITEYASLHPETGFSVLDGDSADAMRRLADAEASFAFVGTRPSQDAFHLLTLCRDRIVMVTPATQEFQRKKRGGVWGRELLDGPVIMREKGSGTRKEADKYLERTGVDISALRVAAYMNDIESIKKAVKSGLGVTILSERVVKDEIAEGSLLAFPLDPEGLYRELYLAYPKRKLSAPERRFLEFVRQFSADHS